MEANALIALTVGAGAAASATGTVLAPALLMYLTARQHRLEKEAEYAREDAREARRSLNADLTRVKQSELDGLVRELALMRRIPNITDEELNFVRAKIADRSAELIKRRRAAANMDQVC